MHITGKIAVTTAIISLFVNSAVAAGPKNEPGQKDGKAGSRQGLLEKVFDFRKNVALGTCTITAKNGTQLTCVREGKTYAILTDEATRYWGRFWGKPTLADIQVNHMINVLGKWTDDGHTAIRAKLVRDLSIHKRKGVFFGTVATVNGDGWVMDTQNRGIQTVKVDGNTVFVQRNQEGMTQADVIAGHRVRVKGLWDSVTNVITSVTQVKDFTLPLQSRTGNEEQSASKRIPKPTVSIAPTATLTPSLTPTPTTTLTPTPTAGE